MNREAGGVHTTLRPRGQVRRLGRCIRLGKTGLSRMDDLVGIGDRQFEIRPTAGLELALVGDNRPDLSGRKAETEQVADNGEIASTPVESGQVKPGGQQGGTGVTRPDIAGR